MRKKTLAYLILLIAIGVDAFAVVYLFNVNLPFLILLAFASIAIFALIELRLSGAAVGIIFGIFMLILALIGALRVLSNFNIKFNLDDALFFSLYILLATVVTIQLSRGKPLRKRVIIYFANALILAFFYFVYALLAVYITYAASIANLRDQGKFAPAKKAMVYISGYLLTLYNLGILTVEMLGIYKPNRNLYIVSALVVVTVLLALRNLYRFTSDKPYVELILPSLVSLYVASYTLIKFDNIASVIDGLAKSLAALAAILANKTQKNFL